MGADSESMGLVPEALNEKENRIPRRQHERLAPGHVEGFATGVRRFVIRTVHDPDESGRYLVCHVEEETP